MYRILTRPSNPKISDSNSAFSGSTNFIMTLDPKSEDFENTIRYIRAFARGCHGRGIRIRGRLGRDNPNRGLYAVGGPLFRRSSQDIKIEHSVRVDIYLK